MSFFHKHNFAQDGRRLWCSCGKVIIMPCNHLWQLKKTYPIYVGNEKVEQRIEHYACVNCGDFKYFNIVTGEVKLENKKEADKK